MNVATYYKYMLGHHGYLLGFFKGDMFSEGSRTYFSKAWAPPQAWDMSPATKILREYIHRLIRKSCSFARELHMLTKES